MNLGHATLLFHILGAVFVGLLIIATLISLIKKKSDYYKPLAISIGVGTCYQLITGSILALSYQNSESIFSFCSKVGFYLIIVLITETLLFRQLFTARLYPTKIVASSLTLGLVFVLITIFQL